MRLADDDRARVPFALVAVLLLLGSATFAATMNARTPGGADPDPGAAIDRSAAATRTVLTQAVDRAARRAARDPVIDPANTTYGRVLNNSTPFRDYLRVRVYLEARRSLEGINQSVGNVRANASLPPVSDPEDLRVAKRRVDLEVNGTTLEVAVRNVTFTASRNGRVLRQENRTVEVAVENPAVVLHDRTETYEARLDAGAYLKSGLKQRLAGLLYPLVWARGYAYFYEAGIKNVLANRHVELATNQAIVGVQRSVFGTADPGAKSMVEHALVQVALRDLAAPAVAKMTEAKWQLAAAVTPRPPVQKSASPFSMPDFGAPSPESKMSVAVNDSADTAFMILFEPGGGTYGPLQNGTYGVRAKLVGQTEVLLKERRPDPVAPGPNWTLSWTDEDVETNLTRVNGSLPPVPDGWHGHRGRAWRIERNYTLVHHWRHENGTDVGEIDPGPNESERRTTTASYNATYRVGVRMVDDHAPSDHAPDRPIPTVHQRGGPLNGSNLETVPSKAYRRLVAREGGIRKVALAAARGTLEENPIYVRGEVPDRLEAWVYRDLRALRERVRNITVQVKRGGMATGANPAAKLADVIRSRRAALVDAPETYGSVSQKVRVAARGAYVQRVLDILESRASAVDRTQAGIGDALSKHGSSEGELRKSMNQRDNPVERGVIRTADGPLEVTVDGAPSYLPLAALTNEQVRAIEPGTKFHALVAENINLFTLPHADAASHVVDKLGKSGTNTSLRAAANALRAANDLPAGNATLTGRVADVRQRVARRSVMLIERVAVSSVRAMTNLSKGVARRALMSGLTRWDTVGGKTLALLNGSAADAMAAAVAREAKLTDAEEDRLATAIEVGLGRRAGKEAYRVSASAVRKLSNVTRGLRQETTRAMKKGVAQYLERNADLVKKEFMNRYGDKIEKKLKKHASKVFKDGKLMAAQSGLPILPSPATQYGTINIWIVNVGGTYARFTVRARDAGPGGSVAYTRDGDPVSIDVDGDGDGERLGDASRVTFDSEVQIFVFVPPGTRGVGDTNGDMFEQSKGWCNPGPASADQQC